MPSNTATYSLHRLTSNLCSSAKYQKISKKVRKGGVYCTAIPGFFIVGKTVFGLKSDLFSNINHTSVFYQSDYSSELEAAKRTETKVFS